MTIVIDVGYPLGYVHATPWASHINEGSVEWPPSPWRLLRALVATWRTRAPDLPEDVVVPVFSALADPPAVRTAARTESSIRAYLPAEGHRRGSASPDTDLVVDAFAAVVPGTGVGYRWSPNLSPHEQDVLAHIVGLLPYLGRAESVCEATASFEDRADGWTEPIDDGSGLGARVLVPVAPLDFETLCVSIRELRKGRRLQPPGTRWVRYAVAPPLLSSGRRERAAVRAAPVTAVRLSISPAGRLSVRQTLVVAEAMRAAAQSRYGALHGGASSRALSGKDADGAPLAGNAHAHWLPLDLDGDRLLDALLVWGPGGFTPEDLAAIGAVRRLQFHGGDQLGSTDTLAVGVEVLAVQPSETLVERAGPFDRATAGRSDRWRSATPFLPQRHRKREPIDEFVADCVVRECVARRLPAPIEIAFDRGTSWGSFRRHRRAERLRQSRAGFGLRLRFPGVVAGPVCLGSLSHYGLGRFVVDE